MHVYFSFSSVNYGPKVVEQMAVRRKRYLLVDTKGEESQGNIPPLKYFADVHLGNCAPTHSYYRIIARTIMIYLRYLQTLQLKTCQMFNISTSIKLVQIKCSRCSLKENLVILRIQVERKHLLPFTVILFILSEFIEYKIERK